MRCGVLMLLAACDFEAAIGDRGTVVDARDPDALVSDAATIDAAPFDVSMCPPAYAVTVPASDTRYRVITPDLGFALHHADCNDDLEGKTHLVVFDSLDEATQVAAIAGEFFYVGGVQAPSAPSPNSGWVGFDGEPLVGTWDPAEPIDTDNVENNQQNLAGSEINAELWDVGGAVGYNAVCECDGKPISPAVLDMIAAAMP